MKQNVSETESNWRFQKKTKKEQHESMSIKQESVSDATCKVQPFSSALNFAIKDGIKDG